MEANFEILIIHKPSLGPREVPHKIRAPRFSHFDVYWIQTDKHIIYMIDDILIKLTYSRGL